MSCYASFNVYVKQVNSIAANEFMSLQDLYKHISLLVSWDNVEKTHCRY
jgi:hypothetical protein